MSTLQRFLENPSKAIAEAKEELKNAGFDSQIEKLISNPNYKSKKICQYFSQIPMLYIRCKTCCLSKNCYFCIPCFVAGNHQDHEYEIIYVRRGHCSCGNPDRIKPEGFCCHHQSLSENPHIDDFGEELSAKIINILTEASASLTFLGTFDPAGCKEVMLFLLEMAMKTNSLQRCCEIAICDKNDIGQIITSTACFDQEVLELFHSLFNYFYSDSYFTHRIDLAIAQHLGPFFWNTTFNPIVVQNDIWLPPHLYMFYFFYLTYKLYSYPSDDFLSQHNIKVCDIVEPIFNCLIYNVLNCERETPLPTGQWSAAFNYLSHFIENLNEKARRELGGTIADSIEVLYLTSPFVREMNEKEDDPLQAQQLTIFIVNQFLSLSEVTFRSYPEPRILFHNWYSGLMKSMNPAEYYESNLSGNTSIYSSLFFEIMLYPFLFVWNENPHSTFLRYFENSEITINEFVFPASVPMIRFHAFLLQSSIGLFARNPDSDLWLYQFYYQPKYMPKFLVRCFTLLQLYSSLYSNKDDYIKLIMSIFGLLDGPEKEYTLTDIEEQGNIFQTIYYISCIIFDRVLLTYHKNNEDFLRYLLISILHKKPLSISVITKMLPNHFITKKFYDILDTISVSIPWNNFTLRKLRPNIQSNPIQPWVAPNEILQNDSFTYPEWIDEPFNLKFRDLLNTKHLFALEYRVLNDYSNKISTNLNSVKYALILILHTHRLFKSESKGEIQQTTAASMEELVNVIPDDFESFLRIKISYMNRPFQSVLDILPLLGEIAVPVLQELGIAIRTGTESKSTSKKNEINSMRQTILSQFRDQRNQFVESMKNSDDFMVSEDLENQCLSDDYEEVDSISCSVCQDDHNNSPLGYPALFHQTAIPNYLLTGQLIPMLLGHICIHTVHSTCAQINANGFFRCPIDRTLSNFLLPKLSVGFIYEMSSASLLSNEDKKSPFSLELEFLRKQFEPLATVFHPVSIIADNVSTLELRDRLHSTQLEKLNLRVFLSNLFLDSWHFFRITKDDPVCHFDTSLPFASATLNQPFVGIKRDNPFECMILDLLNSVNPSDLINIKTLVKKYSVSLDDTQLFVYLRRCAMLLHFALNIDMLHSISSFELLTKFFELEEKKVEISLDLHLNELLKLPQRFIDFYLPPYDIGHKQKNDFDSVCLLTGKLVPLYLDPNIFIYSQNGQFPEVFMQHVNSVGGTSIFLCLNQAFVPNIIVFTKEIRSGIPIITPYVNSKGDVDIGFQAKSEIYLSDERVRTMLDAYLTGNLSRTIIPV